MNFKKYKIGEIFNFDSSKGVFHACNTIIEDKKTDLNHPYIVRTSQNNGIRGYISEDESKLNPENTISFAQDTAQMFYQKEPYFTGNKVKVLSTKDHILTEKNALFLITCMNRAFHNFVWGSSYDTRLLKEVEISLPVKTTYKPDFQLMSEIGGGISMNHIDTSSWKEFYLKDIAVLENGNKMDKNKMTHYNPTINFVSRTANNNGVSDIVDQLENISPYPAGCITLAFGGSVGSCFLQEEPFYTGQNVGVILLPDDVPKDAKLFLISALEKKCKLSFHAFGNEINKHFKTDLSIKLPVTESEEIDWNYMQECITELEQERVLELEQERITELEQYLIATGLNDYTLTEDDEKILAMKLTDDHEKLMSGDGCWKEAKEFRVSNNNDIGLFNCYRGTRLTRQNRNSGKIPLLTAGVGIGEGVAQHISENGILKMYKNDITIDMFGNCFFHDYSHYGDDNIHFLVNNKITKYSKLYITEAIKKTLCGQFSYGRQFRMNLLNKVMISLPIQTDANNTPIIDSDRKYHPDGYIPDWDFMERYIKAIEKIVIKDVVEWKDAVIEKTKEVVA